MNVLHVFSNWKWTGPAEHALNTAAYFIKKGHDIIFACPAPPLPVEDSLKKRAEKNGLVIEEGLYLNKHFHLWQDAHDIFCLNSVMRKNRFDLIHTHLLNDHLIAAMASRLNRRPIPIVRTVYEGMGPPPTIRNRLLLNHYTDSLITVSDASRNAIITTFGLPEDRISTICPGVDCSRFNPLIDGSSVRLRYAIGSADPVLGIVARVQKHRRFDVFIKALQYALGEIPELKALVIGRGTHIEEIAIQPVRNLGLEDHFIFTGYELEGYPELLAALDFKLFLVPGSDGSCRAVREAMAMGKPVIVAKRGMLPELVEDGISGMVVDDTPENLAQAIVTLARDVPLRKKMGEAARKRIVSDFSLTVQLEKVEAVYRHY